MGDKEDREEFSQADEETLVMFASQAALVIANARTHREERQARTDLETLVKHIPRGRGGLRCPDRCAGVGEPGGDAPGGGPAERGTGRRGTSLRW